LQASPHRKCTNMIDHASIMIHQRPAPAEL
jgi:hypothetical protein